MSDLQHQPEDIRNKIKDIVRRSNRDPQYASQLKANPMAELKAAGLPTEAAQAVLDVTIPESSSEVGGYMRCSETCVDTTCWVSPYASLCPGTCIGWTEAGG